MLENHNIIIRSVKFDRNFGDDYFSVKKHALNASEEGLRKLQRDLAVSSRPKPVVTMTDRKDIPRRLEDALAEADAQSRRLEASSVARSGDGWGRAAAWGVGLCSLAVLVVALWLRGRG